MRQEGKVTDKRVRLEGAVEKHSAFVRLSSLLGVLRARFGAPQQPINGSGLERVDDLYEAIWDRIVRAMGSAVVNRETDNWPEYFDGLRKVIRKTIAESSTCGLPENEKEDLTHRLEDSICQLENELHSALDDTLERLEK
jgi:hypothetical protein